MPNEYSGSAVYMIWVTASGTATLSGHQRTVSLNPTTEFIDATAGSDTYRVKIPSFTDIRVSYSGLAQTGGTALEDLLVEGTEGTITLGPEGTAAGKRKYTIGAFSHGVQYNMPYSDVTEMSVEFEGNGSFTRATW